MTGRESLLAAALLGAVCGCGGAAGGASSSVADGGTSPDSTDVAPEPAVLDLPPYPWWENDGLAVDEERLAAEAGAWCVVTAGSGGPPAFFFREMPLQAVASLCAADGPPPAVLMGHMYLSGYYGGLWFRDNADLGMPGGDGEGGGPMGGPVTEEDFQAIAANAAFLADLSAAGANDAVLAHNLESLIPPPAGDLMESMMDALLTLFGYNYGYVKAILESPPEDVDTTGLAMPCDDYLDCTLEGTALAVYAPFRVALDRLTDPPDETWETLAVAVEESRGWAAIGEGLWSSGSISPEAWRILVEINAAYLKVTDVAVLGSLLGAGDGDVDTGRCALLVEAAADTWNRAYFLALGADAPAGTLPGLTCPGP